MIEPYSWYLFISRLTPEALAPKQMTFHAPVPLIRNYKRWINRLQLSPPTTNSTINSAINHISLLKSIRINNHEDCIGHPHNLPFGTCSSQWSSVVITVSIYRNVATPVYEKKKYTTRFQWFLYRKLLWRGANRISSLRKSCSGIFICNETTRMWEIRPH